jgi:hypothetical protein
MKIQLKSTERKKVVKAKSAGVVECLSRNFKVPRLGPRTAPLSSKKNKRIKLACARASFFFTCVPFVLSGLSAYWTILPRFRVSLLPIVCHPMCQSSLERPFQSSRSALY